MSLQEITEILGAASKPKSTAEFQEFYWLFISCLRNTVIRELGSCLLMEDTVILFRFYSSRDVQLHFFIVLILIILLLTNVLFSFLFNDS